MPQDDPIKTAYTDEIAGTTVGSARKDRQRVQGQRQTSPSDLANSNFVSNDIARRMAFGAGASQKSNAWKMMGGNTVISVNSMKGEALRGRSDNMASKSGFKKNRYARSAE